MTDHPESGNEGKKIAASVPVPVLWDAGGVETVPFADAQEAWFWFIQAQQARDEGARIVQGQGLYPRPCEPIDIFRVLDRLHRNRRLLRDHLLVLRHYGRRMFPPDARRPKEVRAAQLWDEAMARIGEVLEKKGIVRPVARDGRPDWFLDACVYERDDASFSGTDDDGGRV